MAFDIENPVGTGTDAELLEFTRAAIAEVTLHGFMRTARGNRIITKERLPALWDQVRILEARIAAAGSSTAGSKNNYARRLPPL